MIDIHLFTSNFYPIEGGAERQLRQVLEYGVENLSWKVTLVSATTNDAAVREARATLPFDFRSPRANNAIMRKAHLLSASLRARKRRGASSECTVVVSTELGAATTGAWITSERLRVPHIVRLGGGGSSQAIAEPSARKGRMARARIGRVVANSRCTVVAPSQHILDDALANYPILAGRVSLMPNGVTVVSRNSKFTKERAGAIWYGRSDSRKGSSWVAELVRLTPDIQFSLIGTEVSRVPNSLLNATELGWVDNPEELIAASAVAVMTSETEGMPNFGLQALAAGTPVAAFDNHGTRSLKALAPEMVSLAPMGNCQALSQEIRRLSQLRFAPSPAVFTVARAADEWDVLFRRITDSLGGGA